VKPAFAPLDSTTAPALRRLMPAAWSQNWDTEFFHQVFRWRYLDRPSHGATWLAFDQDDCVGVIDSFLRPYLLDSRPILVRETADWFCLPEYRPLGLGLKLMRTMMALPEPIIAVGGTEATVSLLPRLGWERLPAIRKLILPASLRGLTGNLIRARGRRHLQRARAIPAFIPFRPPRKARPPAADARVEEWGPGRSLRLPVPRQDGLVALLEPANLDWICAAPRGFFQPMVLLFLVGDDVVGVSLSQLEPAAAGPDARVVHVQVSGPEQPVADWVISETARRLCQAGAGFIRCRASAPMMIAALRRTGFIDVQSEPGFWWSKDRTPPPAIVDIGYLRADDNLPFGAAATLKKIKSEVAN
jgi:hypothetical protein